MSIKVYPDGAMDGKVLPRVGGASVTTSATAPTSPSVGDIWVEPAKYGTGFWMGSANSQIVLGNALKTTYYTNATSKPAISPTGFVQARATGNSGKYVKGNFIDSVSIISGAEYNITKMCYFKAADLYIGYSAGSGLGYSSDGISWTFPGTVTSVDQLVVSDDGSVVYVSSALSMEYSTDGINFTNTTSVTNTNFGTVAGTDNILVAKSGAIYQYSKGVVVSQSSALPYTPVCIGKNKNFYYYIAQTSFTLYAASSLNSTWNSLGTITNFNNGCICDMGLLYQLNTSPYNMVLRPNVSDAGILIGSPAGVSLCENCLISDEKISEWDGSQWVEL